MAGFESALKSRKVLVTGASGFIGRPLVAALVAAGAEVTALGRTRHSAAPFRGQPVRCLTGAMGDPAAARAAVAGQEVIFNLAYDFRDTGAANVAALETLIAAAEAEGRARIVHTSSIVVYDDWPAGTLTESSPMDRPGGSPYRQAKVAMERRLMGSPLPVAILQPTIVWGPGSSLWTDGFAEALIAGAVVLPEPEGLCQGVYVDDVVQACLRAAVLPDLGRERFIINGPEPFPWSALLEGYSKSLGRGEIRFAPAESLKPAVPHGAEPEPDHAPSAAARISALGRRLIGRARFEALVRAAKRRLKRGGEMRPDAHLYELMVAAGRCPSQLAADRFGFSPTFGLVQGLQAVAPHLAQLGRSG
ncbi:NAD(P)-dependent oxidoreductase [Frigidibacter sp. SD6-1]|uniref:NAD-dependent epimerase/dehydratase family protein n=1 Tax=Frigidibacter sp. SD6-1 TaxID=3032581 RepID=UPI0024DF92AE|nr:NAD(P)-dependent oxidoreductase [Frigidibacter sp. SD6-1]